MKRSHPSREMDSRGFGAPFSHKHLKVSNNTTLKWSTEASTNLLNLSELFSSCFERMPPHIWFDVVLDDIESHDSHDDLSYATGQPVSLLRNVMLQLDYISTLDNSVRMNLKKIEELCRCKSHDMKLH